MAISLALKEIRKSFDGDAVLDEADLAPKPGRRALLGKNATGKSSLMNVADGLYAPEAGPKIINGRTGCEQARHLASDRLPSRLLKK